MNDVATGLTQQHLGSSRNDQLTRSDNWLCNSVLVLHWIVVFPPPLLAGDVNNHFGVTGLGKVEHGAEGEHTDNGQNERRNNRQRDFQRRVAVRLMRNWLSFVTELKDSNNHHDRNEDPNNSGNSKHWLLEIVNNFGVRSLWLERVLGCICCTTCKEHGARKTSYCSNYSTMHARKPIDACGSTFSCVLVSHGTITSMLCPASPGMVNVKGLPASAGLGIFRVSICSDP